MGPMEDSSNKEQAVELLQQLGLKEYEAKSFVALSRLPEATAKEISEISEVPRTRVYDAVRVLESKGLVEIQHANPQLFRAVSIDEAANTLRAEYESRTGTLREILRGMDSASVDDETDVTHEVWALSGITAISNRTRRMIDEAEEEFVLVIGHEKVFTEELIDHLRAAHERGVTPIIGTVGETLRDRVQNAVPEAEVFVSGLEWLDSSTLPGDDTKIGRLLLVDRTAILVSSYHDMNGTNEREQAVFGRGFDNGIVTITRRLMATGLLPIDDPGVDGS